MQRQLSLNGAGETAGVPISIKRGTGGGWGGGGDFMLASTCIAAENSLTNRAEKQTEFCVSHMKQLPIRSQTYNKVKHCCR